MMFNRFYFCEFFNYRYTINQAVKKYLFIDFLSKEILYAYLLTFVAQTLTDVAQIARFLLFTFFDKR